MVMLASSGVYLQIENKCAIENGYLGKE